MNKHRYVIVYLDDGIPNICAAFATVRECRNAIHEVVDALNVPDDHYTYWVFDVETRDTVDWTLDG